ncbi:MAG TPA: hypothetical protein PKV72_05170 [Candidatus Peribacteria bacterium]|nr:hypothetical protein [Candidatus Peribacteria bacterium]
MASNASKHFGLIQQVWMGNMKKLDQAKYGAPSDLLGKLQEAANRVDDDAEKVREACLEVLRTVAKDGETI